MYNASLLHHQDHSVVDRTTHDTAVGPVKGINEMFPTLGDSDTDSEKYLELETERDFSAAGSPTDSSIGSPNAENQNFASAWSEEYFNKLYASSLSELSDALRSTLYGGLARGNEQALAFLGSADPANSKTVSESPRKEDSDTESNPGPHNLRPPNLRPPTNLHPPTDTPATEDQDSCHDKDSDGCKELSKEPDSPSSSCSTTHLRVESHELHTTGDAFVTAFKIARQTYLDKQTDSVWLQQPDVLNAYCLIDMTQRAAMKTGCERDLGLPCAKAVKVSWSSNMTISIYMHEIK